MEKKQLNKPDKKQDNSYLKYSTISFQLVIIVLAGVFGGLKLDKFLALETPVFTVVLSLLSIFLGLYYTVKDLLK